MSKAQLINKLIILDPKLCVRILRNEPLAAKLKTDALLKELGIAEQKRPS